MRLVIVSAIEWSRHSGAMQALLTALTAQPSDGVLWLEEGSLARRGASLHAAYEGGAGTTDTVRELPKLAWLRKGANNEWVANEEALFSLRWLATESLVFQASGLPVETTMRAARLLQQAMYEHEVWPAALVFVIQQVHFSALRDIDSLFYLRPNRYTTQVNAATARRILGVARLNLWLGAGGKVQKMLLRIDAWIERRIAAREYLNSNDKWNFDVKNEDSSN